MMNINQQLYMIKVVHDECKPAAAVIHDECEPAVVYDEY